MSSRFANFYTAMRGRSDGRDRFLKLSARGGADKARPDRALKGNRAGTRARPEGNFGPAQGRFRPARGQFRPA